MVCFPAVPAVAPPFLCLLVFAFPLRSFSEFFPHAVATVDCFRSSSVFFRQLQFWLSLPVSPPPFQSVVFLSVLWSSSQFFRILRLRLLFDFGTPPAVFRAAGSPLAVPWLSGCCFPCFSAGFLSPGFLRLLCFSSLSLGLRSLPWCLFLLVLVVVFFAPALGLSPPVLPCYVAVASGCLFSDSFESLVPVATWSPFGTSQVGFGLCFFRFRVACLCWYPFCFVSTPFL